MEVKKANIAILISGRGSNLQALIDACQSPDFPARIEVVISNIEGVYGLERAKAANIKTETVPHKDYKGREAFDAALLKTLEKYKVDLICLAGFMRILTPVFIDKWPERILNTHPALLPRHGGKGMYGEHVHKAVLSAGDAESGVSIHYVTSGVDEGPVILQRRIPVKSGDTWEDLAARVLKKEEHIAYPEAVRIAAKKLLSAP